MSHNIDTLTTFTPEKERHKDYFKKLMLYNSVLQNRIGYEIEKVLPFGDDHFCIATTGSDARLEKAPVSLIEIILFSNNKRIDPEIPARLINYVNQPTKIRFFEDHVETKQLDDHMSECVIKKGNVNINLISPNRIFDARLIYGNPRIINEAKTRLSNELNTEYGKKVLEHVKKKTKEMRNTTLSGIQRIRCQDTMHFDIEGGTAYYDPDKYIWSFKIGPLRAVQFAIVRDQINLIRSGCHGCLNTVPENTMQKLEQLQVIKKIGLTKSELSDLCDNYKYFLWQYHKSQNAYQRHNQIDTSFDSKETKERLKSIEYLCSQKIII